MFAQGLIRVDSLSRFDRAPIKLISGQRTDCSSLPMANRKVVYWDVALASSTGPWRGWPVLTLTVLYYSHPHQLHSHTQNSVPRLKCVLWCVLGEVRACFLFFTQGKKHYKLLSKKFFFSHFPVELGVGVLMFSRKWRVKLLFNPGKCCHCAINVKGVAVKANSAFFLFLLVHLFKFYLILDPPPPPFPTVQIPGLICNWPKLSK